ncbi:ATP-binding sensor histidine kinase [Nostoc sp. 106C]|uniref:trifunctional serine/threonine-protein kinase/ATP-binding protein/sensor histidine kinase n=1 Tax=Nostoc sp. 106C TaxID=1932667 RepID=UPI000A3B704E|nr:ATP-binding sensor histidine kinase [Nostoc sp. 106C]OUL26422.1 serine/threonine protein kinase [Nostoc sp. 106C]
MTTLLEYKVRETVYEDSRTVIYRTLREKDQKPVILKTLRADCPTLEEISQLRHEYDISKRLKIAGIVQTYGLENYRNSLILVLEDFGGQSIKQFIDRNPIDIISFLKIAIQLANTLFELHQNQIIHKDIKSQNIIINPESLQVKITDFSIASRLSKENPSFSNAKFIQGTLAYMSPEQTGRMNRSIDYRTDFYSLGVTFYEILTGKLPFATTDPMELVHCHIAKQPLPPSELNPKIPVTISNIILKLLAKTAEDRYQSALGLQADLENCLVQLQVTGQIENFLLGEQDRSGQLQIPQKLYGREAEVATLIEAFVRVATVTEEPASSGATEMMLVAGYSGIGKSALVNEVHKPIVKARGYFIAGKFDQFKRNIPYSAVVNAFQDLIRQLLTESQESIAVWNQKLLEALGANAQAIVEVIPEVELIIGQQPDIPQLGPTESQNRFNRAFQKFIQVFAQPIHPLVLFLDDLQWSDSASLKLIQLMMTDPDSKHLLLIGAYRDNEVSPTHPLMVTLEEIKKTGATVNAIALQALDVDHVCQIVADTLKESEKSQPFAELLFNKTQGNPFFLTQLLQTLHQDKLLTFNFKSDTWQWDIAKIQTIGITDYNVVELVARNIQKLPPATQEVLKLAACIGNSFNLDVLAIVHERSQPKTATELWSALQSGLILPLSNAYKIPLATDDESQIFDNFEQLTADREALIISYKFLHDRVQQAAYSLIPEEQKKETHLKVGQLLLKNTPSEKIEENIFDIVNQLNIGVELISERIQKDDLARLNLIAGRKAKAATAYEPAVRYLRIGLGLLAPDSWQTHYDLTLNLYVEAAEAEYLNTNFQQSAALTEVTLQNATNLLDKVKVYELQIQFYFAQSQMSAAMDTGLSALEMLGVSLTSVPNDVDWVFELPQIENLDNLLIMSDPHKLAILRLLITVSASSTFARPEILPLIILTQINFCIEQGYSGLAAFAYALYGMLLCTVKGETETGYLSGQLALELLDKFNARELKCKVYNLVNLFIRPWKEHVKTTLKPFIEGAHSGLETGDIEFSSYCAMNYCTNLFWVGEQLDKVQQQQTQYFNFLLKLKQEYCIDYIKIVRQLTLNLLGKVQDKYQLTGESFDESQSLPAFLAANNPILLFTTYNAKLILLYLFKDFAQAVASAKMAAGYITPVGGWVIIFGNYTFFYSLALLGLYSQAKTSEKQQYLALVEEHQQKMQQWALRAPCNFQHKYELVEAEKARVLGQIVAAMELYDRAIAKAKEHGYIQDEALANELAAEFYFSLGREKVAQTYLIEAYYTYIRWGATAKVKDLESSYPEVFSQIHKRETSDRDLTQTTNSTSGIASSILDFTTFIKASQALTGEIVLSRLLEKLLKIVMENAGAQTSYLLLEKEGQLLIEAKGSVEQDEFTLCSSIPVATTAAYLPLSLINYVIRTKENIVLNHAVQEGKFTKDPYIAKYKPKSILCIPLVNQCQLIGILYLENNLTTDAFTSQRLEVLGLLSSQMAISLKNALLYANLESANGKLKEAKESLEDYSRNLEQKVKSRTLEIQEKNQHLQQALQQLQQTQTQLIQTEKMSSLGQLVAGVAHEINNPINFINGNLVHTSRYLQDLLQLVEDYEQNYPDPVSEIIDRQEAIDLEFLKEDLPKTLESMKMGANRIREIVLSLRNFSRLDEAEIKDVDIHEGIDSTLLILQHRLKEKAGRPRIEIYKDYIQLPEVECYPGQLNQVFINILTNAIDAIEQQYGDSNVLCSLEQNNGKASNSIINSPAIHIRTQRLDLDRVAIHITDNGPGMKEEVRSRVFDPFFTTKPIGSGTGLGLSICYQTIVEKHRGQLKCNSAPGQGAEFIIEIPIQQQN